MVNVALVNVDEHSLLLAAQQGDTTAFGEMVERYQTSVYSVCWRLLGDRHDAEDATQEAFVRAYQRLHTFDRDRSFGPWIRRVAANYCFNHLESAKPPMIALDKSANVSASENDPARLTLERERDQQLHAALQTLAPNYRIVVELRHFQELSYEEIAEELGQPLSSVKTHLFRARRLLADQLRTTLGTDDEQTY